MAMKKTRKTGLGLWLILSLLLTACSIPQEESPMNAYKIITATDLHYLAPEINDKGQAVRDMTARGDGKMTVWSHELVEAFLWQVEREKPDLLLLTGDLTLNSELKSHQRLANRLQELKAKGTAVALMPGNHDLNNPFAVEYQKDKAYVAENTSPKEFKDLYGPLSYDQARLKDPTSFSYVMDLTQDLSLLIIDTNQPDDAGQVSATTKAWLQKTLDLLNEENRTILSASHQNILIHNQAFTDGFMIKNHEILRPMLEKAGVRLNLSGHIHIQDLAESSGGLFEAATSSLAVSPHRYAQLTIKDQTLDYASAETPVTEWAMPMAAGKRNSWILKPNRKPTLVKSVPGDSMQNF